MNHSLRQLAEKLGGTFGGNGDARVSGLRPIEDCAPDCISPFFRKKYLSRMEGVPSALLVPSSLVDAAREVGVENLLVHENPPLALAELIDLYVPPRETDGGIQPGASVSENAQVASDVWIGPGAVVEGDTIIAQGSWIGPNAVICSGTVVGRNVRIGPCAVVGYEGFGFIPSETGPVKVRQVGRVVLEDGVEIGACACVDRGTLGDTVIGRETKLDNLVQVGHNARVGRGVLAAAQTGLAGSTVIGDGVMLGGQSGIADHVEIGRGAIVAAQGGVVGDIREREVVAGLPAVPRSRWRRAMATLMRLADRRSVEDTEER